MAVSPATVKLAEAAVQLDKRDYDKLLKNSFYRMDEQRYTLGKIGDTIKNIKLSKESERNRALQRFSVKEIFANSIVEEALTMISPDIRFSPPAMTTKLQYKEEGVAGHLDLENRCVCARLAGDECLPLLLDGNDRNIVRASTLSAHGTNFLLAVHHMVALGLFFEARIKMQAKDPSIAWLGVQDIKKQFFEMVGPALNYVHRQIHEERAHIIRQVGADQSSPKALVETMYARNEDPATRGGADQNIATIFNLCMRIKRKLQIVHDQAIGLNHLSGTDETLASPEARNKFVSRQEIEDYANVLETGLKLLKEKIFNSNQHPERFERFWKYYQMSQMMPRAGGTNSRYMTRIKYWAGMKFQLIRNPFLITNDRVVEKNGKVQNYDQVTANNTKNLLPGEAKQYYVKVSNSELVKMQDDIKRLCNHICDIGCIADMLMSIGILHNMMEASLLRNQEEYQSTVRAVAEGRRRIAKRVQVSEAKVRATQMAVLKNFSKLIPKHAELTADVHAGILEKNQKDEEVLKDAFKKFEQSDIDDCLRQSCLHAEMLAHSQAKGTDVAEIRQMLMFSHEKRGCAMGRDGKPSSWCTENVTSVPTFAIFWPNMMERTKSYEVCQAITSQTENRVD